jgi:hypothetical protein
LAYTSSNYMTTDVTRSLAIRIKQHEPRRIIPLCPIPASSNNILLRRHTLLVIRSTAGLPTETCHNLSLFQIGTSMRPTTTHATTQFSRLRFYANDLPNRNEDSKNTLTRQHRTVFRARLLAMTLGPSSGMTADPARRLDRLQEMGHARY